MAASGSRALFRRAAAGWSPTRTRSPRVLTGRFSTDSWTRRGRLGQSGSKAPTASRLWGVNVRAVEENGRLLVNLLNLSRAPQQVQLVTKPAAKHALNLMDGKQIEFPIHPFALGTGGAGAEAEVVLSCHGLAENVLIYTVSRLRV